MTNFNFVTPKKIFTPHKFISKVKFFSRKRNPFAIYTTWEKDVDSSIIVHWHTLKTFSPISKLKYRELGTDKWFEKKGEIKNYPGSDNHIHWCKFDNLKSDTIYEIKTKENGDIYRFKTMEKSPSTIKFAIGGDSHNFRHHSFLARGLKLFDIDFFVSGGDFTDSDGLPERYDLWERYWEIQQKGLQKTDKTIIPIIPCIGNHDVDGGYTKNKKDAPFFYSMFGFPQAGYGVLDFGENLSVIILDTDHTNNIENQTEWLFSVLSERANIKNVIPVYHVSAYPSFYGFSGSVSQKIRDEWVPLFEQYENVKNVFEHHNHSLKTTITLINNEKNSNGILYHGDGALGTNTRTTQNNLWYAENIERIRHFYLLTITNEELKIEVVTEEDLYNF